MPGAVEQPGADRARHGTPASVRSTWAASSEGVDPGQHGDVGGVGAVLAASARTTSTVARSELAVGDEADLEGTARSATASGRPARMTLATRRRL